MRNYTKKHGIYKNLPDGTVYNSQAMALIFMCTMVFKISSAPGIIAEFYGSSTLWFFLLLTAVEIAITVALFTFVRKGGDGFLISINCTAYKILCAVAAVLMTCKGVFYFCFSSTYLMRELFSGLEPAIIYIVYLAPVIYVGLKGVRTIARSCEIFFLIFFGIILLNLIFLKTDMDFGRNLPVFSMPPKDFFANFPRYGLWFGDMLPMAFVRIKNKKLPYTVAGISVTYALINVIVMLGSAIYGESLKTVSDLLVHLAGFNQLSLEIGRLDWTTLLCMLTMSIYSLSFLYWGVIAASTRAFKASSLGSICFPIVLLAVTFAVPSTVSVSDFSMSGFGYFLFAAGVGLPVLLLGTMQIQRMRFKQIFRYCTDEYIPYPPHDDSSLPNSLADGIMYGFKAEAADTQTHTANGMLQPDGSEAQQ